MVAKPEQFALDGLMGLLRRRGFCFTQWVGPSSRLVGVSDPLSIWAAECDSFEDFSSTASVHPGIGFVRIGGTTTVHLRGPANAGVDVVVPE